MSNELVQVANTSMQQSFDWNKTVAETKNLVKEDAELTSTIDEAMIRRFEVRVKIGQNLIALQDEHSHHRDGNFTTTVLPDLDMNERFAYRCIGVAKLYQQSILTRVSELDIPALPMNTWNQLASPSTHSVVVEQVLSGEIEASQQAIKEANEKVKKAEEQARLAQQQLLTLQQEVATLTTPERVEVPVIPPETTAKLEALSEQVTTLTRQKENLAKLNEELSADLDANEDLREREARELRIRKAWQDATDAFGKAVNKFVVQLPLPIDTQSFDAEEWARLTEIETRLKQTIVALVHPIPFSRFKIFLES